MSTSTLLAHGSRIVTREELDLIKAPESTATWFPVDHSLVIDTVSQALVAAGFQIERMKFAVSRTNDARLFAVADLTSVLATGVNLAVGIRNSFDRSLPLGFVAGSKVFVCDNLQFRSELIVARKHTRHGAQRFQSAICQAIQSLVQFRTTETARIRRLQFTELTDLKAESVLLRSYEQGLVSHRLLPRVIEQWRKPSFEEFEARTAWSLLNAFTTVIGERLSTNPQEYAALTIRLQAMLDQEFFAAVEVGPAASA